MANGISIVTFDPFAFVKRLTSAGLSVELAETLAAEQSHLLETVSAKVEQATSKVASKDDFKEYKAEAKTETVRIEANIEKHESKVLQAIADSRKDTHQALEDLRKDTHQALAHMEARFDAKFESQRKELESTLEKLSLQLMVRLGGIMIATLSAFKLLSNFFGK